MSLNLLYYLLSAIFVFKSVSLEDQRNLETLENSFRKLNSEEDILEEFSAEDASLKQSEDPAYISELFLNAYPVGGDLPDCPSPYKSVHPGERELNKGAGGLNIYLCAKYSQRRDFSARGVAELKVTVDIKNPPAEHNPTPPEGYVAIQNNISDNPLDLNAEAGKWMRTLYGVHSLYLWQKISNDTDHLIVDINLNFSSSSFAETACLPNYKDTGVNLNFDAGGDAIRLCYLKFQYTVEEIAKSIQTEYSQYPSQVQGPQIEYIQSLFLVFYPNNQLQENYDCPFPYQTVEPIPRTKQNIGEEGLTLYVCKLVRGALEPFVAGIEDLSLTTGTENPPEDYIMVKNQFSDGHNKSELINLSKEAGGTYLWQKISTDPIHTNFVQNIDLSFENCPLGSVREEYNPNLNLAVDGSSIRICWQKN